MNFIANIAGDFAVWFLFPAIFACIGEFFRVLWHRMHGRESKFTLLELAGVGIFMALLAWACLWLGLEYYTPPTEQDLQAMVERSHQNMLLAKQAATILVPTIIACFTVAMTASYFKKKRQGGH